MNHLNTLFERGALGWPRVPHLFLDFDHLFGDLEARLQREPKQRFPRLESRSTEVGYELKAALPGVPQASLQVNIDDGVLTISGKRNVAVPDGFRAHSRERESFEFTRRLRLPADVDPGGIQATAKDGVLTLVLPKRSEVKPRQVPIQNH